MVNNYIESQNTPENFVQRSKYAGCYDFCIQETRNELFHKSKERCTVYFRRQKICDILLSRQEKEEKLVLNFDPENAS